MFEATLKGDDNVDTSSRMHRGGAVNSWPTGLLGPITESILLIISGIDGQGYRALLQIGRVTAAELVGSEDSANSASLSLPIHRAKTTIVSPLGHPV
jgi:hypothetical protein